MIPTRTTTTKNPRPPNEAIHRTHKTTNQQGAMNENTRSRQVALYAVLVFH
jgi:hypothetical protein